MLLQSLISLRKRKLRRRRKKLLPLRRAPSLLRTFLRKLLKRSRAR